MTSPPFVRLASCLLIAVIGACATSSSTNANPPPPAPTSGPAPAPETASPATPPPTGPRVGGDRDEHGCIGSAGYSWCARENRCVRPWEVAREHNIAMTGTPEENARAFAAYCAGP